MTEENRIYITHLKVTDVPWHRLTTAYGRGTEFPAHLTVLERMEDMETVKKSLYELTTNMEHQSTLWHATPFGMVFLSRILEKALAESGRNPAAHFLAGELLDFFSCILQCFHDGDEMEHASPLPCFSDLLKEEYLWSEEYDEEEDEMRYEEDEVFPDDLFYSFYYYSWQEVKAYYIVDTLQTAIQESKQISFQYYEHLPTKEKVLKHEGYRYQFSPYSLIWNRDFYYMVGWSEKHNKIAQFRVDRITGIELLALPGRQTPGFDPTSYVQKVFGMYPDNLQTVTLLCRNHLMRSVIDRFGETVQTKVVDDDHFLATVEVAPSPPFFAWVFTFAGEIRIVSPKNVLEEMREMARWLQ